MVETVEKSFDDFFLSDEMLKALSAVGYEKPTPVQAESIPLILAGIDLIVQSQTGSGKTAAFAVPTIEMLEPHPGRIEVLVLAPTRELAKQSASEFERLGQYKDLSATSIYGGASYEEQYEALKTAQIVCATPGRLLDLANRGNIDLSNLRIFCLDEADEMLSMGFREELNAIVEFLPEERQSLLFSATVNEEIKALAKGMLYYPEYISLSGDQVAAAAVTHVYYRVKGMGRQHDLVRVLEYERPDSGIIFCNTRDDTFTVTKYLQNHGYRAKVLNGDLPQKQREATLAQLRQGKVDFIVATDVAARGIDITDLSHVINYALPSSAESYVHRTGRTGRAGKTGRAISLVAPADMATHFDIMSLYEIDITHRELPSKKEVLEAQAEDRLATLVERVLDMEEVSTETTGALADQLLEGLSAQGEAAETNRTELRQALAKLLSLADMVLRDDKIADIVTGRAKPVPAKTKPVPEVAHEVAQKAVAEPEAPKKAEDADEKPTRKSSSRRGASRRRSAKAAAPAPAKDKAAEDKAEKQAKPQAAPTPEASEPRRRRRRRSRGSKSSTTEPTTQASAEKKSSRASSRGARKGSTGARRRKSSRGSSKSKRRSSGGRKKSRSRKSSSAKSTTQTPSSTPSFSTSKMYMNVGRDHVDNPDELIEMICYMSGFSPEDFGDISVQSSYSFVQVRDEYFYDIINAMNNQEWNGVSLSAEPARK